MPGTKRIRVAIIDDNDLVRAGYGFFFDDYADLELVGSAADGDEAVTLCSKTHPDVVLMDLMMPRKNGVAGTLALKRAFPHIQVIILSGFGGQHLVDQAIANGAAASLHKDVTIAEMADAVRLVYSKRT
jgi:DNA-binding NarL/FixJ family response regulator